MELLEYFYENRPKNEIYYPRKLSLPIEGSVLLHGTRSSGKTTLILEHLSTIDENILYIDCQDPIFALEDIDIDTITEFIKQESITVLVLDHWYREFLDSFPKVKLLIIVTRKMVEVDGIDSYFKLYPLDYEEFLGFGKSGSVEHIFNKFLKLGTIPQIAISKVESLYLKMRRVFYEKFNDQESRLLLILARFQGRRVTNHQIYTNAKEYFKISKDWTYKSIKEFEEEGIVIFIDDIDGGRKMFLYDFVFTRYLNKYQPFAITFDAMTALALHKHKKRFKAHSNFGYFLEDTKEFVIPSFFETEDAIKKKINSKIKKLISLKIKNISVVTVSNRFSFDLKGLNIEAMPFYEWSILND